MALGIFMTKSAVVVMCVALSVDDTPRLASDFDLFIRVDLAGAPESGRAMCVLYLGSSALEPRLSAGMMSILLLGSSVSEPRLPAGMMSILLQTMSLISRDMALIKRLYISYSLNKTLDPAVTEV